MTVTKLTRTKPQIYFTDIIYLIFHSLTLRFDYALVTRRTDVKNKLLNLFLEKGYVFLLICHFNEIYCKTGDVLTLWFNMRGVVNITSFQIIEDKLRQTSFGNTALTPGIHSDPLSLCDMLFVNVVKQMMWLCLYCRLPFWPGPFCESDNASHETSWLIKG